MELRRGESAHVLAVHLLPSLDAFARAEAGEQIEVVPVVELGVPGQAAFHRQVDEVAREPVPSGVVHDWRRSFSGMRGSHPGLYNPPTASLTRSPMRARNSVLM